MGRHLPAKRTGPGTRSSFVVFVNCFFPFALTLTKQPCSVPIRTAQPPILT